MKLLILSGVKCLNENSEVKETVSGRIGFNYVEL